MNLYVIAERICGEDIDEPSFWKEDYGFVGLEDADVYDQQDRETLRLPMYGYWLKLPPELQSARLAQEESEQEQSPF